MRLLFCLAIQFFLLKTELLFGQSTSISCPSGIGSDNGDSPIIKSPNGQLIVCGSVEKRISERSALIHEFDIWERKNGRLIRVFQALSNQLYLVELKDDKSILKLNRILELKTNGLQDILYSFEIECKDGCKVSDPKCDNPPLHYDAKQFGLTRRDLIAKNVKIDDEVMVEKIMQLALSGDDDARKKIMQMSDVKQPPMQLVEYKSYLNKLGKLGCLGSISTKTR